MSKPTVGDTVHFYSAALANRDQRSPGYGFNGQRSGPYVAIVTQVFTDDDGALSYVNLKVLPPFAGAIDEGSVSYGKDRSPDRYWVEPSPAA